MAESITVPFTALDLIFLAHLILSISKYRNLCAQSDKMTLFLLKKRGGILIALTNVVHVFLGLSKNITVMNVMSYSDAQ